MRRLHRPNMIDKKIYAYCDSNTCFDITLDPCPGVTCKKHGFDFTEGCELKSCACGGKKDNTCEGGNRCDAGVCKCGDSETLCKSDASEPNCVYEFTGSKDSKEFKSDAKAKDMICGVQHSIKILNRLYTLSS